MFQAKFHFFHFGIKVLKKHITENVYSNFFCFQYAVVRISTNNILKNLSKPLYSPRSLSAVTTLLKLESKMMLQFLREISSTTKIEAKEIISENLFRKLIHKLRKAAGTISHRSGRVIRTTGVLSTSVFVIECAFRHHSEIILLASDGSLA